MFSMLAYELITRQRPYEGSTIDFVRENVPNGKRPTKPHSYQCPVELWKLIRECWKHGPKDRPSMTEVKQKLEQIIEHQGICT